MHDLYTLHVDPDFLSFIEDECTITVTNQGLFLKAADWIRLSSVCVFGLTSESIMVARASSEFFKLNYYKEEEEQMKWSIHLLSQKSIQGRWTLLKKLKSSKMLKDKLEVTVENNLSKSNQYQIWATQCNTNCCKTYHDFKNLHWHFLKISSIIKEEEEELRP